MRSVPPPVLKPKRDAMAWKEQRDAQMHLKGGKGAKRGAVACSDATTRHFWELDELPSRGEYHGVCRRCGREATTPAHPTVPFEPEGSDYAT